MPETCKAPWRTDHDLPDFLRVSGMRISTVQDHNARYRYIAERGGIVHTAQGLKRLAVKTGISYSTLKARFHEGHYHGWKLSRVKENT